MFLDLFCIVYHRDVPYNRFIKKFIKTCMTLGLPFICTKNAISKFR